MPPRAVLPMDGRHNVLTLFFSSQPLALRHSYRVICQPLPGQNRPQSLNCGRSKQRLYYLLYGATKNTSHAQRPTPHLSLTLAR
jgi:hypothetical protein